MEKKLIKIYLSTIEERYLPFWKVVKKYSLKQFKEDKKSCKKFPKTYFLCKTKNGSTYIKKFNPFTQVYDKAELYVNKETDVNVIKNDIEEIKAILK